MDASDPGDFAEITPSAASDCPDRPNECRRPTVVVQLEISDMVLKTLDALDKNPNLELFQRGGMLVHVTRDLRRAIPGLSDEEMERFRPRGTPSIAVASEEVIRQAIDDSMRCVKDDPDHDVRKKVLPPQWLVRQVMARKAFPFPHLDAVTEAPTLRPDGSILQDAGYDERSGVLYEPGHVAFERVPDRPTREDAAAALACVDEALFADFPFKAKEDRSAALAAALSVLARSAIAGPVPLFGVGATTPCSGKTLLVNVIATLVTGRSAPTLPPTPEAEEDRKRVLTVALEGCPIILVDNVRGAFGSEAVAGALTSQQWKDRILGRSESPTVPLRGVWFVTGNNLSWKADFGRRVMPIDLEPQSEHPEEELRSFKHGQDDRFLEWVRDARAELVPKALTAVRAFLVAGKPRSADLAFFGTFSAWDELIRGTLVWIGYTDPFLTRERLKTFADAELNTLRCVIRELRRVFELRPQTAAAIVSAALLDPELKAALKELCPRAKSDVPTALELGYALRSARGRIVELDSSLGRRSFRIEAPSAGTHEGVTLWKVDEVIR